MQKTGETTECLYEFARFRLSPTERLLLCDGQPVQLPPKVFDTLLVLVEHGGHLMEKDELLDKIWADAFVEEGTLARNISILRRVLGENADGQKFIETVPKRGYRFTEPVRQQTVEEKSAPVFVEEKLIPEIKEEKLIPKTDVSSPPKKHHPVLWLMTIFLVAAGVFASLSFWNTRNENPADIKSIAVLPFKSLNPEADNQYLGLGIADSIIAKTSRIDGLKVRPTSAVRKYVNSETDALEAAREQNVEAVLDGTIQQSGERLRVSVNLLNVGDGTSLWAETFDLNFNDIFKMQDEVSRQIAVRLRLKLDEAEAARIAKRDTSNPEAFNYYTKAMYHSGNIAPNLNTRSESDLAIDLFKKAIELDPNYALAHAQLGYAYTRTAVFQEEKPALIELARQEIAIAERLNPQLAEVHAARYFIVFSQYEGWQIETAVRELRLAQEIDPNVGHSELGDLFYHIGLEQQGFDEFETALKIDPNSDMIKSGYVTMLLQAARPDDALEANKRLFNRGPDLRYYLEKGMVKEAAPRVEEELQKNPDSDPARNQRMLLLALQGKHEEAQAFVPVFLEKLRKNRGYHHYTYNIARVYALGGKSEKALKWLRVTVKEGFPCYPLFERDPFLEPIRNDPKFAKFLVEMKERWEGYLREFG